MKVSELLAFYEEEKEDVSDPRRLRAAVANLKKHMGGNDVSEVDVSVCRIYRNRRRQTTVKRYDGVKPVSDSTIARELGVLKAAANMAVKWKKIPITDMPMIDLPKNLPKREIWFHKDELQRLFGGAGSSDLGLFIRLLYYTASRRAAIERLEWTQCDFATGKIALRKPGEKETKKRRPTVPMGVMKPLLEQRYAERTTEWVLTEPMDRYRQFVALLERVDLLYLPERDGRPAGRVTPHSLRHSRATHLLEAGMGIYKVAQLLGDNPLTVQRVYAHASVSDLADELTRFD